MAAHLDRRLRQAVSGIVRLPAALHCSTLLHHWTIVLLPPHRYTHQLIATPHCLPSS